jgi:TRAP-type C4-dicarboxylate transport system substrate-binding protein
MANEWAAATNGQVRLRIFHGGVAGDEDDMIRKLRINSIQGAVLTSFGLNMITPEIMTLSVPFLIRNDVELQAVLDELGGEFEALINRQGFHTLAFVNSGWVRIFSRNAVRVPADLRRQIVGTSPDSPELTHAFRAMEYRLAEVAMSDMHMALNSGRIDAVYKIPAFVGGLQLFGITRNMASFYFAPFMGGIVLNQQAWRAVPEQHRERLMAISRMRSEEIGRSISQLENDAIRTMQAHGLAVNNVTPAQMQLWQDDVDRAMPALLGAAFDADIYRRIEDILQRHRSR